MLDRRYNKKKCPGCKRVGKWCRPLCCKCHVKSKKPVIVCRCGKVGKFNGAQCCDCARHPHAASKTECSHCHKVGAWGRPGHCGKCYWRSTRSENHRPFSTCQDCKTEGYFKIIGLCSQCKEALLKRTRRRLTCDGQRSIVNTETETKNETVLCNKIIR